ncbi:hypothetical protein I4F81_001726 [Pyropia yezoensis]|uniref:Uncharacterized protein n=1 Tax=Pyropia yezoensis TaxID=2788 RepID=A0ACC3BMB9_PYRYE|nr:hypothetical protein I4F81_001726 [Neopyropia yezoensis]
MARPAAADTAVADTAVAEAITPTAETTEASAPAPSGRRPTRRRRTATTPPAPTSHSDHSLAAYYREIGAVRLLSQAEVNALSASIAHAASLEQVAVDAAASLPGGRRPTREEWAAAASLTPAALDVALADGRDAKERLVVANLRLVVSIARRFAASAGSKGGAAGSELGSGGVAVGDLIQEGTLGLIRGAEKYDATRGYAFTMLREDVASVLRVVLPEEELAVVVARYGLDGGGGGGVTELARRWQIPSSRVRQAEERALRRLRKVGGSAAFTLRDYVEV